MNPNYASNPHSSYYQSNTGPPQPQWQLPPPAPYRTGWHDPRMQHAASPAAYQAQSPPYNPNTYGPMPPSQYGYSNVVLAQQQHQYQAPYHDANTASWGVKYNQQHHDHLPAPPLPPRPPSTNPSQVDTSARPPQSTTPLSAQDRPNNSETERPAPQSSRQSWRESFYNQAFAEDPVPGPPPPPPPPRPTGYQAQPQQPVQYNSLEWPHEHYSNRPPSHHYDPTNLQQPSQTPSKNSWSIPTTEDAVPVSPEERQHKRWDSSSFGSTLPPQPSSAGLDQRQNQPNLPIHIPATVSDVASNQFHATVSQGFGAPSDWERFTPTDLSDTVSNLPPELPSTPTASVHHAQLPPANYYSNSSKIPHNGRHFSTSSNTSQPSTDTISTPDPGKVESETTSIRFNELSDDNQPRPNNNRATLRQGSVPSTHGANVIQRSGTIDSVIDAWNAPVSQHVAPGAKVSTNQLKTDERPVSPPSQTQSPEGLPKTPDHTSRSIRPQTPEAASSSKGPDPYKDVDPEYHSSLTRFLKMLKQEGAASSEQDKYIIFHSFIQKELRIRQALYGIEPDTSTSRSLSQSKNVLAMPTVEEADTTKTDEESKMPRAGSQIKRKALRSGSIDSSKSPIVGSDDLHPINDQSNTKQSFTDSKTSTNHQLFTDPPPSTPATQVPSNVLAFKTEAPEEARPSATLAKILTTTLPDSKSGVNSGQSTSDDFGRIATSSEHGQPNRNEPRPAPVWLGSTNGSRIPTGDPNDGPNVVINHENDEDAYSPGGRPLLFRRKSAVKVTHQMQDSRGDHDTAPEPSSPSNNAPMVIDDYVLRDTIPPGTPARVGAERSDKPPKPPTASSGRPLSDLSGPVKFEPPRPVYTPFRYNETANREAPHTSFDKPADEAYSTLRNQAAESGRLLSHEVGTPSIEGAPAIASPTSSRREHQETFLGLIRRQSKVVHKGAPGSTPAPAPLRVGTPLQAVAEHPIAEAISALRNTLPPSLPKDGHLHENIISINKSVESLPDDFGFIKETVLSWDGVNKEVKRAQDEDRDKRQSDSEAHIDELFNSNEISYADIRSIEEDFKLAEAEFKYREDQQELQSFIAKVYTPIYDRLQEEILRLTPSYTLAVDMLDLRSEACSRLLDPNPDRVQMAVAMDVVLDVFGKLEIRYQKLAEARFERERRRKTLESAVLSMNGNVSGVKKLEQEFTAAEKLQVLEEAHDKDKRANNLMDTFDRATVRGLGDNQTYVDEVLSKIRKIKDVILKKEEKSNDALHEADSVRQTLGSAQEVLNFVLADSRTILTTANAADNILNEADYRVSVSKARVANADDTMFQKLQEDRAKEDAKILEEMGVRIDSMAKGPAEATMLIQLIQEIQAKIGDGPDHQDRIRRALEEAKRRNAAK